MALVDVVKSLGLKLAERNLTWHQALILAAKEPLVDPVALRIAQVELGDEGCRWIYDDARHGASAAPEEIPFDSITSIEDQLCGRADTEPNYPYWTVDQLILGLARMRNSNPEAGRMRVTLHHDGSDLDSIGLQTLPGKAPWEDELVLVLK